jgi:hypothetical protein
MLRSSGLGGCGGPAERRAQDGGDDVRDRQQSARVPPPGHIPKATDHELSLSVYMVNDLNYFREHMRDSSGAQQSGI